MLEITEGSMAVAEAVRLCRPQVVSAYPITPQTHIVEALADMVANGKLDADYITVESEFSALSACLGASAAGSVPIPRPPPRDLPLCSRSVSTSPVCVCRLS